MTFFGLCHVKRHAKKNNQNFKETKANLYVATDKFKIIAFNIQNGILTPQYFVIDKMTIEYKQQ